MEWKTSDTCNELVKTSLNEEKRKRDICNEMNVNLARMEQRSKPDMFKIKKENENKYLAYSSQGSHTGQLYFCNWLAEGSTTE